MRTLRWWWDDNNYWVISVVVASIVVGLIAWVLWPGMLTSSVLSEQGRILYFKDTKSDLCFGALVYNHSTIAVSITNVPCGDYVKAMWDGGNK